MENVFVKESMFQASLSEFRSCTLYLNKVSMSWFKFLLTCGLVVRGNRLFCGVPLIATFFSPSSFA